MQRPRPSRKRKYEDYPENNYKITKKIKIDPTSLNGASNLTPNLPIKPEQMPKNNIKRSNASKKSDNLFSMQNMNRKAQTNEQGLDVTEQRQDDQAQTGDKFEEQELAVDDLDPTNFSLAQRTAFLMKHKLADLKQAYSVFVSGVDISNLSKTRIVQGLVKYPAFAKIYELLTTGSMDSYVPVWTEREAFVKPPTFCKEEPWATFYKRKGFPQETYKNGKAFLSNWGIETMACKQLADFVDAIPTSFVVRWSTVVEPELRKDPSPNSIYDTLLKFYNSLNKKAKDSLPNDFVKKASMIYDRLSLHRTIESTWTASDLKVKVYGIWHDFFSEFTTKGYYRNDKAMECVPKGSQYQSVYLYPDTLMKNSNGVPCIFMENELVEDNNSVDHKYTFKALSEGRVASTFTLSEFDTEWAKCFLILNAGKNMTVIELNADLNEDEYNYELSYSAQVISDEEKKDTITLTYDLTNYSQIIQLFLAIYIQCNEMDFEPRDNPITFTKGKVKQDNAPEANIDPHTPAKLPKPNKSKDSGGKKGSKKKGEATNEVNVPFPLDQEILLKTKKRISIVEVNRKIRKLQGRKLCGKVLELDSDGQLPFELRLMQRLDHPNIMKFNEVIYNDEKTHCMAIMDYIFSATNRRLCGIEKTAIAQGILNALDYLHNLNIVHADVKLSNTLTQCGDIDVTLLAPIKPMHPYLIDFGESFDANNPPTDAIIGTDPYIAPEVRERQHCSKAMDMWGYGLFLFELYFGWGLKVTPDLNMKQLVKEKYDNQKYKFMVSESLFDLIWKCLEEDPAKRITTKQALQHPFWTNITRMVHNSPIIYFVLGSVMNLDGPVDWDAVAKEDQKPKTKTAQWVRERELQSKKNNTKTTTTIAARPKRKALGNITNLLS